MPLLDPFRFSPLGSKSRLIRIKSFLLRRIRKERKHESKAKAKAQGGIDLGAYTVVIATKDGVSVMRSRVGIVGKTALAPWRPGQFLYEKELHEAVTAGLADLKIHQPICDLKQRQGKILLLHSRFSPFSYKLILEKVINRN